MSIGKYVPIVATLIVAVVVMAGVAFPMIGGLSSETTTVSNDGASWIRMGYITDQSDYSAQYTFGDNISVAGQSGDWEDMILYADSQCTICIVGDYLVKIVGDSVAVSDDPQTVTVSRSNGIVSIDGEPVSDSAVSWAYVPVANGKYSSFGADTVPLHKDVSNLAAVGGFAGVYAYNENVSMDLGFVMDADVTEEYINSVRWALESDIPVEETQPFHPIDPGMFDPGVLNPGVVSPDVIDDGFEPIELTNPFDINGNQIMSVPTPTYTDGDWGYELDGSNAIIVSYSGAAGAITIPTTVGGYTVTTIGKGGSNEMVFTNSTLTGSTLTIPEGIVTINKSAFQGCNKFTGSLVFPSTLRTIGQDAFNGCSGFTGTLTIPALVSVGRAAFAGCSGFTTLVNNSPYYSENAFRNCSGLTGTLTIPVDTNVQNTCFENCTGLTGVTFSGRVYQLLSGCFRGCTGITEIEYPVVTGVSASAFDGCTGITKVTFAEGVTSTGYGTFSRCTGITEVVLPSTLTTINAPSGGSYGVFQGCTSLKSIDLVEGITTIGQSAFRECSSLESIVLPSTVTSIGWSAFAACDNLRNVVVLTDAVPSGTDTNATFYGSGVTQVLNLSSTEWTTTSYGLDAEEVRTDIEATSYMAPISVSETTTREGPTFDLLAILPIIFVAGLLLTTAWMFIRK